MSKENIFEKAENGFHNVNRNIFGVWLPEKLYPIIKISDKTQRKIEEIQEYLGKNESSNILWYGNHNSRAEPFLVGYMVGKIDPNKKRHVVTAIGADYLDYKKLPKNCLSVIEYQIVRCCGLETLPVIQTDKDGKPINGHTLAEASEYFAKFTNRLIELVDNDQPTAVILFPEGTRSEDGKLQKAKPSIVRIAETLSRNTQTICIPIGTIFDEGYERDSMNIGREVEMTVGDPYIMEKGVLVHKTRIATLWMQNLANVLLPNMQGYYEEMPQVRV